MTVEVAMSAASFVATERSARSGSSGCGAWSPWGWVLLGRGDASAGLVGSATFHRRPPGRLDPFSRGSAGPDVSRAARCRRRGTARSARRAPRPHARSRRRRPRRRRSTAGPYPSPLLHAVPRRAGGRARAPRRGPPRCRPPSRRRRGATGGGEDDRSRREPVAEGGVARGERNPRQRRERQVPQRESGPARSQSMNPTSSPASGPSGVGAGRQTALYAGGVVVTDHLTGPQVVVVPEPPRTGGGTKEREASWNARQPLSGCGQGGVAVGPRRPGSPVPDRLPDEVGEHLAAPLVDAEDLRDAGEADGPQVAQQRVHGGGVGTGGPADGVPPRGRRRCCDRRPTSPPRVPPSRQDLRSRCSHSTAVTVGADARGVPHRRAGRVGVSRSRTWTTPPSARASASRTAFFTGRGRTPSRAGTGTSSSRFPRSGP